MTLSSLQRKRRRCNKLHIDSLYLPIYEPINGRPACKLMIGQDVTCLPTAHPSWLPVWIPESPVDCVHSLLLLVLLSIGLIHATSFPIPVFAGCRSAA